MFYSISIDSLINDNHSKASALDKFKSLLYNCYPSFLKIDRVGEHLNLSLVLLYDCVPNLSQFSSIDKLLKNVPQLGMGKNPVTLLYSDTTKRETFFGE